MSETLGSLVDRLSILNIKLWHAQDVVHECARENKDIPAKTAKTLVELNSQRNRVMTELDELLRSAIETGKVDVDSRPKFL